MFGGVGYDACHRTANYAQSRLGAKTIERNGCISPDSSRIFRRLKEVREIFRELGAQALRTPLAVGLFASTGFIQCAVGSLEDKIAFFLLLGELWL